MHKAMFWIFFSTVVIPITQSFIKTDKSGKLCKLKTIGMFQHLLNSKLIKHEYVKCDHKQNLEQTS